MCTCTLLSCSTFCDWAYAPLWASTSQRMRHLGEDSSQSSSTDEAAKVYTAPWLRRKGLGDRCSMMMHDATMWNDRYGLVGFGLVWFGLVCYVWLGLFGSLCLFVVFGSFCFALFTSLPTTYFGSDWIDPLLCQCVKIFGWNIHQRVGSDALHGFGKSWIKTSSSGSRTSLYMCTGIWFACICICCVCVCGIKLYFILPLSLQFLYYVTVISYYHILTQYIILEFKISNTKILNLDSPPTHQTQQSTKARRRKRRQRLGSSGIKMRIKFEPCFDPLLSISNRMWISRVYRSSNTVKYLAFETIAIRYNMIVCKYMYFISSIFCNWVCYNSFPAINCKTWTN